MKRKELQGNLFPVNTTSAFNNKTKVRGDDAEMLTSTAKGLVSCSDKYFITDLNWIVYICAVKTGFVYICTVKTGIVYICTVKTSIVYICTVKTGIVYICTVKTGIVYICTV